jgi:hypothetical protein
MAIVMVIDHGPGKGKTYVDDSCVVKTKEEVEQIYRNCSRIYYEAMLEQERRKLYGSEKSSE